MKQAAHPSSRHAHLTNGVLGGIGSFGALLHSTQKNSRNRFSFPAPMASARKLKIAMAMDVHSTVGGDLVNHCVNDILVQVPNRSFSSIISRLAKWIRTSSSSSWMV